ncbi:MAG: hypothetical protein LBV67_10815 [Streptococcaceae bacterium]|nr:hypothetical protein [Streptococcaceae bacterium]
MGLQTRKSFVDDVEIGNYLNQEELKFSIRDDVSDITQSFVDMESIKSVEDLEEVSPIIVKVKVNKEASRKMYSDDTLTTVEVLEVMKGQVDKKEILVFEPIDINHLEGADYVNSTDGYNWMNDDEEYILYLRPLKAANYSKDKIVYLPTTTLFSKYSNSQKSPVLLDQTKINNCTVKYSEIEANEVLITDYQMLEKFLQLKDQVIMENYNSL